MKNPRRSHDAMIRTRVWCIALQADGQDAKEAE